MKRLLTMTACVLLYASAAAAQNPCQDIPLNQFRFNPTELVWTTTDFTTQEADGSWRVSGLRYAVYAEGANPSTATPVQGPSSVPRASITLVPGTTDCYRASLPALLPTTERLVAAARQYRDANPASGLPAAESPWSPVSNPFGSAPSALPAPGLSRVR